MVTESCGDEKFVRVAFLLGCFGQGIAVAQVITEAELTYDVVADASRTEVLHAVSLTVGVLAEQVFEVSGGPFVNNKHRLAAVFLFTLFAGELFFLNFYVVFLG